jgi:hypothetical protein
MALPDAVLLHPNRIKSMAISRPIVAKLSHFAAFMGPIGISGHWKRFQSQLTSAQRQALVRP